MTDIDTQFEQAASAAKLLGKRPDNDTLLSLYALFKQASEGDVSGEPPGFFDFVGTAKYAAWEKLRGMSSADAKRKYIDLVNALGS